MVKKKRNDNEFTNSGGNKMIIDLGIVGLIVILIGATVAIMVMVLGPSDADAIVTLILSCSFLLGFVLIAVNNNSASKIENSKLQAEVQAAVDDEYEVYVDGQEVDIDNIDLDQYSIVVDKEKEKIFCSTKGRGIVIKSSDDEEEEK